jgi:sialic acid synthase SpsE
MEHTKKRGMIFISTPFSRKAVDRLVKFKVPNGSYDIVEKIHDEFFYKNIAEFAEHGDLLGHYIKIQSLRSDKN